MFCNWNKNSARAVSNKPAALERFESLAPAGLSVYCCTMDRDTTESLLVSQTVVFRFTTPCRLVSGKAER